MANDKKDQILADLKAVQQKLNAAKPELRMNEMAEAIDALLRHAIDEREGPKVIDGGGF